MGAYDRLKRGALEAWTRPQQAALDQIRAARQKEEDLLANDRDAKQTEHEAKQEEIGQGKKNWKDEAVKVEAGSLVDDLVSLYLIA